MDYPSASSTSTPRSSCFDDTLSNASTIWVSQKSEVEGDENDAPSWLPNNNTTHPKARNCGAYQVADDALNTLPSNHSHTLNFQPCRFGDRIKPIRDRDTVYVSSLCKNVEPNTRPVNSRKTILRYLRSMSEDADAYVSCAPTGDDLFDLLGSFEGPLDTPYAGGIFYVRMIIPQNYPFSPPRCVFLTKVFHPNINSQGQICLNLLDEDWSPITARFDRVLISICALLSTPNTTDALVPEIANQYLHDHSTYDANARLYTLCYAAEPRPSLSPLSAPLYEPAPLPSRPIRRPSSTNMTHDDLRNLFERLQDSAAESSRALGEFSENFSTEESKQGEISKSLKSLAFEIGVLRKAMMGWAPADELQRLGALAEKCVITLRDLEPVIEKIGELGDVVDAVGSEPNEENDDDDDDDDHDDAKTLTQQQDNLQENHRKAQHLTSTILDELSPRTTLLESLSALYGEMRRTRIELYGDCLEMPEHAGESSGPRVLSGGEVRGTSLGRCPIRYAQESLDQQRWDPALRKEVGGEGGDDVKGREDK